jgi:hypothetical protein
MCSLGYDDGAGSYLQIRSNAAFLVVDDRAGSLPCELNWIACIPLLLLLFGKQLEDCLSVWLLSHALTKTTAPLNVLASDEPLHLGVYSWDPSVTDL